MSILKNLLIVVGILISACLYWILNVDQTIATELTLTLIEQQTALGIPLWVSGFVVSTLGFIIPKPAENPEPTVLNKSPSEVPSSPTPVEDGGVLAKDDIDESMFMEDWKLAVQSEVRATILPSGSQIIEHPFNNVQLGLTLKRTTPQNSRLAMVAFAEMLTKIPTPPRVRITFIDIMATGIPLKNVAQGAFTQYFGKTDFILTEQIDGLEVRFNNPDECWKA